MVRQPFVFGVIEIERSRGQLHVLQIDHSRLGVFQTYRGDTREIRVAKIGPFAASTPKATAQLTISLHFLKALYRPLEIASFARFQTQRLRSEHYV